MAQSCNQTILKETVAKLCGVFRVWRIDGGYMNETELVRKALEILARPSRPATTILEPEGQTEPLAAPPSPCRLCGVDSWWRSSTAEAWPCRTCHPPASLPVYETLSPHGKLGDAVRTQPRADTEAWLAAWRELAAVTNGVTADDSRVQPVMTALEQCDTAYLAGDWPGFQRAAQQVRQAAEWGRAGQ